MSLSQLSAFFSEISKNFQCFQWVREIIKCEFISATEGHLRPLSKTNHINRSRSNSPRKVHFFCQVLISQSALE